MENSLRNKKERFTNLNQDLEMSINAVNQLADPSAHQFTFELGDTLYGRAAIAAVAEGAERQVGLWLGAGVMLEYSTVQARQFLEQKREERQEELRKCDHDLEFIRKQITTTEVTLARLYNHLVRQTKVQS